MTTVAPHPELTALRQAGERERWWREQAVKDDGHQDAKATKSVRGECESAYSQGLLSPATVTVDTCKGDFR